MTDADRHSSRDDKKPAGPMSLKRRKAVASELRWLRQKLRANYGSFSDSTDLIRAERDEE